MQCDFDYPATFNSYTSLHSVLLLRTVPSGSILRVVSLPSLPGSGDTPFVVSFICNHFGWIVVAGIVKAW